jgi:hypothetical protein
MTPRVMTPTPGDQLSTNQIVCRLPTKTLTTVAFRPIDHLRSCLMTLGMILPARGFG